MSIFKAKKKKLPEFYLEDKYLNKISFKYYYAPKKSAIWDFGLEYRPIFLKVNYLNNPRQKQCSLNSTNNLLFEKRFSTKIQTFSIPLDEYPRAPESIFKEDSCPFNFKLLETTDLIRIDKKLLELVVEKYFESNDNFETGRFISYYEFYSKNIYESIDTLCRDEIIDLLNSKGYPSLTEKLLEAKMDTYKLLEVVIELEAMRVDKTLTEEVNLITGYSLHLINNANMLSSEFCNTFNEFHVSSNYLTKFDFCIPLPNYDLLDSYRYFPLNEIATQYYFPYYLWERYFDQIRMLNMPQPIQMALDQFNSKLKSHLLSTLEFDQYID